MECRIYVFGIGVSFWFFINGLYIVVLELQVTKLPSLTPIFLIKIIKVDISPANLFGNYLVLIIKTLLKLYISTFFKV